MLYVVQGKFVSHTNSANKKRLHYKVNAIPVIKDRRIDVN